MTPYYEQDGITIYHGDCREVLPGLGQLDCIVTDPPYQPRTHDKQWISHALSANGDKRAATAHSSLGFDPIDAETMRFVCKVAANSCLRWFLTFCEVEATHIWRREIEDAGLEFVRICIWDKVDSAPQFTGDRPAAAAEGIVCSHRSGKKRWNGGGRRNVFREAVNGERGAKPHPSTKPVALMLTLVKLFSDESELLCDPFMGSGTTLVAAKRLARRAIGIETEEKYCEIAAKRLAQGVLQLSECN